MLDIKKPISQILILCCLWLIPYIGNAQKDLKATVSTAMLDDLFADWDQADQAGIAVGVISNGKVVYKNGFGSANLEHDIPITTSTKFYTGTWSRQFTAFLILLLESEGKLSLQDDIRKYIPEVPQFSEKITLHHLLSHTSGLDSYTALKGLSGWEAEDVFTKRHAYQFLQKQTKLNASPGSEYAINDTGFMLLEEVVARISGKSFAAYAKERIFDPLKMNNSFFEAEAGQLIKNKATGYIGAGEDIRKVQLNYTEVGPSNFFTTIDDILLWMLNFENIKVGNAAILKKMDTPAMLNGAFVEENNRALYLGQHRFWDFKGTEKLYIIGGGKGYSCKMIRFPDQDLSAVVLGNAGAYNGYMTSNIADLYLYAYYETPTTNANTPKAVASKKLSTKQQKALVGTYWNSERFFTTTIEFRNDSLHYQELEHNWGTPLAAIDNNTFDLIEGHGTTLKIDAQKGLTLKFASGTKLDSPIYDKDALWASDLTAFTGVFYAKKLGTSYHFEVKDGQLVATHERMKGFTLDSRTEDTFTSDNAHFAEIVFERNKRGDITAFKVNNARIKGVRFEKVKASVIR